jgi:tetratricopeptide (TPR) repeat protein
MDRGQFAEAERLFRAAVKTSGRAPGYPEEDRLRDAEWVARAAAQGRAADAAGLFEKARELVGPQTAAPAAAQADMQAAAAHLAAGDRAGYEKALARLSARFLAPADTTVGRGVAATLAKLARVAGRADETAVLSRVAWAFALGGAAGWDAAGFEARYAAALRPDAGPWAWRGLALVRLRAGKLDEAEAALAKAARRRTRPTT